MKQSTKVETNRNPYLVSSRRSAIRKILETIGTVVLWTYVAVVCIFFGSAFLGINPAGVRILKAAFKITNSEINAFVWLAIKIFIIVTGILYLWKYYNQKRFGSLDRRKYPEATTIEDLERLNLVDLDTLEELQNKRVIIFEKNPIKDIEE